MLPRDTEHLTDEGLDLQHRVRAEQLIFDLLEPVEITTVEVTMQADERALEVARALVANPSDSRSLAA